MAPASAYRGATPGALVARPVVVCKRVVTLAQRVRHGWEDALALVLASQPHDLAQEVYIKRVIEVCTQAARRFGRHHQVIVRGAALSRAASLGLRQCAREYRRNLRGLARQCEDFLRSQADDLLLKDNLIAPPGSLGEPPPLDRILARNQDIGEEVALQGARLRSLRASLRPESLVHASLDLMDAHLKSELGATQSRRQSMVRHRRPDSASHQAARVQLWQRDLHRAQALCKRCDRLLASAMLLH